MSNLYVIFSYRIDIRLRKECLDAEHLACPEAKRFNQHFLQEPEYQKL